MNAEGTMVFTDSRGVEWQVRVTGPTRSGSLPKGGRIDDLPEVYFARYRRQGSDREFEVDLYSRVDSAEALRELLESQPEWQFEEWTS